MTDQERKVMEMALKALENNQPVNYCQNNNGERFPMFKEDPFRFDCNTKAIKALRQALAQQALADSIRPRGKSITKVWVDEINQALNVDAIDISAICVDETEKREHEPVAWVKEGKVRVGFGRIEERKYVQFDQTLPIGTKLFAAPVSKREWVSLTDEKIEHEWVKWKASVPRYYGFAKGIEAALKEKNT